MIKDNIDFDDREKPRWSVPHKHLLNQAAKKLQLQL